MRKHHQKEEGRVRANSIIIIIMIITLILIILILLTNNAWLKKNYKVEKVSRK